MCTMDQDSKRLLIIDTDGGTDDCHGILVAAAASDVAILAITCVMGNVEINQVCQNVLTTIHASEKLRKAKCPIYPGATHPLAGFPIPRFDVHGEDGLGNVQRSSDLEQECIKSEPACIALVRLVNEYPDRISIAAIGPLTNLALAMRIDPTFSSKVKDLVIMGGDMYGRGNITPCAEFNFAADPEGARVVLREFTCPKTLISWELTLKHAWNIDWMRSSFFIDTHIGRFLRDTHEHILEVCKEDPEKCTGGLKDKFTPCDQLAMAVTLSPDLVTQFDLCPCSVETGGVSSRGHLVIDRGAFDRSMKLVTPTKIVTEIDFERFKQISLRSVET